MGSTSWTLQVKISRHELGQIWKGGLSREAGGRGEHDQDTLCEIPKKLKQTKTLPIYE